MPTIREQASDEYADKLRGLPDPNELDRFTLNIIRAFIENIETQLAAGGHVVFTGDQHKLLQWTLGLLDAHNHVTKEKRHHPAPRAFVRTVIADDDPDAADQERVGSLTEC